MGSPTTACGRSFGADGAHVYAEANQAGLERIAGFVEELAIDCDLRRKPNFTYVTVPRRGAQDREGGRGDAERRARQRRSQSGWTCRSTSRAQSASADQAEFHPRRYVLALARHVAGDGSHVFEHTRVLTVDQGDPCRVLANGRTVTRRHGDRGDRHADPRSRPVFRARDARALLRGGGRVRRGAHEGCTSARISRPARCGRTR